MDLEYFKDLSDKVGIARKYNLSDTVWIAKKLGGMFLQQTLQNVY